MSHFRIVEAILLVAEILLDRDNSYYERHAKEIRRIRTSMKPSIVAYEISET